jgi:preprotein translocase subunit SecF
MSAEHHGLARRLYRGETAFPLIQRRRIFYVLSIVLVLISLASMIFRGFNLGVEFKGGTTFQFAAQGHSEKEARNLFEGLGVQEPIVQTVGRSGNSEKDLRVQVPPLTQEEVDKAINTVSTKFGVDRNAINPSSVGPQWGSQVTNKALRGLVFFLIGVIIYISIRFEPKMALAAIIALIHDLALAAGVYSITHFVVTPSTIVALLTVLGYSLYDTIVVFDKVEENTRGLAGSSRSTYSEAAELAVNQTFMRSINTSLIALLPVSGLLFVGAFLLGAGTLKDLSLALFVGLASGAYSSLFLATPLLADLKEREPQFKALRARVLARRSGTSVRGTARTARTAEPAGPVEVTVGAETEAATGGGSVAVTPAAPRRPSGSGQAKRKGGRPGRPAGKRRR